VVQHNSADFSFFGLIARYTLSTRSVYYTCMPRVRTNIEIEDTYLQAVMDRYRLRTKTEAVDLALRTLAGQPMSRDEALAMRGTRAIGKAPRDAKPRGT
jgi:Arc/MetJ family transcription regulator